MNFLDKLFKQQPKQPTPQQAEKIATAIPWSCVGQSNYALNLSAVFRAVDFISSQFAMLNCEVVKKDSKGVYRPDMNHPAYYLLSKHPNDIMTRFQLMKQVIVSILVDGNAYLYINRNDRGQAISILLLDAKLMTVNVNNEGKIDYRYSTQGLLSSDNVIHIRNLCTDGILGISTLAYARQTVDTSSAAEKHAHDYYHKKGMITGVLSGTIANNKVDDVKKAWANMVDDSGIAFIGANMTYQSITPNSKDAQLLESRLFTISEIGRFFNINPSLLYDLTKTSYTSNESAMLDFLQNTLMPLIDNVELAIHAKLFLPSEKKKYDIRFDITNIVRGDLTTTASYYSQLMNMGAITTNELRAILGYESIEGGDIPMIQSNLVPIDYIHNKQLLDQQLQNITNPQAQPKES